MPPRPARVAEVLRVALRLGLTSFGGPAAHIALFRREYVERRHWLDETAFCGPASSQLGIAIGTLAALTAFRVPPLAVVLAAGAIAHSAPGL